jgi:hypothetical protein
MKVAKPHSLVLCFKAVTLKLHFLHSQTGTNDKLHRIIKSSYFKIMFSRWQVCSPLLGSTEDVPPTSKSNFKVNIFFNPPERTDIDPLPEYSVQMFCTKKIYERWLTARTAFQNKYNFKKFVLCACKRTYPCSIPF